MNGFNFTFKKPKPDLSKKHSSIIFILVISLLIGLVTVQYYRLHTCNNEIIKLEEFIANHPWIAQKKILVEQLTHMNEIHQQLTRHKRDLIDQLSTIAQTIHEDMRIARFDFAQSKTQITGASRAIMAITTTMNRLQKVECDKLIELMVMKINSQTSLFDFEFAITSRKAPPEEPSTKNSAPG